MRLPHFVILATAFIFFQCEVRRDLPRPNIVWICAEDISPAFGAYGDTYAVTPNIDALADLGLVYDHAYATAPICSPSRSCLITGVYATAMGTQHLRNEIHRTPLIKALPEYLRERGGYFTSLYGKTDYNFNADGIWDSRSRSLAPWRARQGNAPFFSMFTIGATHEGNANSYKSYRRVTENLPDSLVHDSRLAKVPPYFPDNDTSRWLWSRYYDLITDFDMDVGNILDSLEADGLMKNTIIFLFSDHGFGMPRYKRWLNETGLRVPLIVYIPEAYKHLFRSGDSRGQHTDELVSFVDYAPTVLSMAGLTIPGHMQGQPFLGSDLPEEREFVFGARSRADDMYEISRACRNDRYLYIRHFIPRYPYIQTGVIFDNRKEAFRLLRKAREEGDLPGPGKSMFNRKPNEELYDLDADPYELDNLADRPEYLSVKSRLKGAMTDWILRHRDVGFLIEPEMMCRAGSDSPYTMAREPDRYHLEKIFDAAEWVGKAPLDTILKGLKNSDSGVRWWAISSLGEREKLTDDAVQALVKSLDDAVPSVQVAAAEVLCTGGHCSDAALQVLTRHLQSDEPWLALYAARATQLIGTNACAIRDVVREVHQSYMSPDEQGRYKDDNFASFIGWALEVPLEECGSGR